MQRPHGHVYQHMKKNRLMNSVHYVNVEGNICIVVLHVDGLDFRVRYV